MYYVGPPIKPRVLINSSNPVHLNVTNVMLSLKCVPEEHTFNYEWEKRDSPLSSQTKGVNSSYLIIYNLKPEDAGEYRCIMSNSTGKIASNYTELIVNGIY